MSKQYETVIGLEVHVELATKTKIFCGCSTAFGGAPNTHTCPVCTGMPGSLPVLNKQVVEYAAAVGLATNCSITQNCKFDRKNYFYPDNPQNYQISQLYLPICRNGHVDIKLEDGTEKAIKKEIKMGQVKSFNDIIADYLKQRAEEDTLFAPKFANPNKSIDECCRYILGEARKRGTAVAMSDSEVFGMAVHYYDEENIKIEKVSAGCSVSSSRKVKLTEEEKKIAREAAIKRLAEEQYQLLKKKPAKKKADTNVQQMSLF